MHSTDLHKCFCFAVEVKKEPEAPTEIVKQEEREPGAKSSAPAPPSKQPPEKRARLQWHLSSTLGRMLSFYSIPAHLFTLMDNGNKLALGQAVGGLSDTITRIIHLIHLSSQSWAVWWRHFTVIGDYKFWWQADVSLSDVNVYNNSQL